MSNVVDISSTQLPPPSNWQDFESLCCDLWTKIWNDPNTQKNGRSGQNQSGVDISGKDLSNSAEICGVQCKGKDNYLNRLVSITDLEEEVNKAKKFKPSLSLFIMATSGHKDAAVEQHARQLTEKHEKEGLFRVVVMGWRDILEKLSYHEDILRKYYPLLFSLHKDPVAQLYDFWRKEIPSKSLVRYCCELPFHDFDIKISEIFTGRLQSYLAKVERLVKDYQSIGSAAHILRAISNFNLVCRDLLTIYLAHENKHYKDDIYIYWVNCSHLEYSQRGKYISYRKCVLQQLHYELIRAANHIISTKNKSPNGAFEPYVPFSQDWGEIEYFPFYDDDVATGSLYPGYYQVDLYIRRKIYPELEDI
ncbi:TPA: hypothetical protein N2B08_005741 [Pseudomonas aeruginosa]|uniref:hypothetical protein n=1 Tax=Pseudomonas aeruginosa TaxID=287 RepID=UPI000FF5E69E|nr:hypothetical protein [Pseudomonas aeruginosa]RWY09289.1 hypothetical protein EQH71_02665 [Pseudomonas aeruginosa]WCV33178.1 hypothetical protein KKY77_11515 [Pseudomonas aeruginosa]HCL3630314.1 hypothetical protein [Pseudomonas aeruginosa]HEP9859622.1 hypothetical protein [Pseudomonas aeruginosa]